MPQFYQVDSTKVSLKDLWWGWASKLIRIRITCSIDDPNVDSTLQFLYTTLPPDIDTLFAPLTQELAQLGFFDPIFHIIYDSGSSTSWYWATFRHASGQHFARIQHRGWAQATVLKPVAVPTFMTRFADGTFLVSSAAAPDFKAPETVQTIRKKGAKVDPLRLLHEQKLSELADQRTNSPVSSRDELIYACEDLHIALRDFYLARGVFTPRNGAENTKAQEIAAKVQDMRAHGYANPEVLLELDRLQNKKTSKQMMIWILLGSLGAFLVLGATQWTWKLTLWIVPILLFHEAGHWLMMRIFKYRNVRMFFIPMFGAAVMGRHWNVPGWKKALVSLAGPLPGILAGLGLGIASIILHNAWMNKAALLLLLLNGMNLLPIFPMDGGHVLQDTIFCRNRWLEAVFRFLAIGGLLLLGLGSRPFVYLGIALLVSIPITFKLAKVKEDLSKLNLPQPGPTEDSIPLPTADAIIRSVKAVLGSKMRLTNKVLAQHSLNVFESLNARPPGVLATLGLLAMQGTGLFIAVVMGLILAFTSQFSFKDFARAAVRQPQHSVACGSLRQWGAPPARPGHLIVTTFKKADKAAAAFQALTNQIPANSSLTLYGQSVLLSIPAGDDSLREKWFDVMQERSTNLFIQVSNTPVLLSMQFIAPTKAVASNIIGEVSEYLHTASSMHLIAPWSPEARQPNYAKFRSARAAWQKISSDVATIYTNKIYTSYNAKIRSATKRGSTVEAKKLTAEQDSKLKELRAQALEKFSSPPNSLDASLANLYGKIEAIPYTNRVERQKLLREVAAKLGEVAYINDKPDPKANCSTASSGVAEMHDLLCELRWTSFGDPQGPVTLTDWLCGKGCLQFKYDLHSGGWLSSDEDESDTDMP
jgi:Zn-dependent protease